ncbi:oocyte zinc finger protein XlCOF7.1-like [Uranotaenia lowii]|uniref:oocyte zinc finger protein XlCOF7.1-like n=1 Tax=Uranotaenia lowii TaxID=190385 RepID=UPI00247870E4|nr:oocyte zinc finger protein XlCOF7.1-like [Uranotaenia lowii]
MASVPSTQQKEIYLCPIQTGECLLCLSDYNLVPLLSDFSEANQQVQISEVIKLLTGVQVPIPNEDTNDDQSQVCNQCRCELQDFWKFRNMCRAANATIVQQGVSLNGNDPCCRLCFSVSNLEPLFSERSSIMEAELTMDKMVSDLISIELDPKDEVHVCNFCVKKIGEAATFRKYCLKLLNKGEDPVSNEITTPILVYPKLVSQDAVTTCNSSEYSLQYSRSESSRSPSVYNDPESMFETMAVDAAPRCESCDKTFKTANRLIRHNMLYHRISTTPALPPPEPLKDSEEKPMDYELSETHSPASTGEIKTKFLRCDACNTYVKSKEQLANHTCIKIRIGGRRRRVSIPNIAGDKFTLCEICYECFCSNAQLTEHQQQQHPDAEVSLKCAPCKKRFPNSDSLRSHLLSYHFNYYPFLCDDCGNSYHTALGLQTHVLKFHTGEHFVSVYFCQFCDIRLSTSEQRTEHMKEAHNYAGPAYRMLYRCTECQMEVVYRRPHSNSHPARARTMHQDKWFTEIYRCNRCQPTIANDGFPDMVQMAEHLLSEHEEKLDQPLDLACCECEARFAEVPHLRVHFHRVHNKEGDE